MFCHHCDDSLAGHRFQSFARPSFSSMICPGMSSEMIIPTASRCVKKPDPCIIERLHNFDFCQLLQCYENVFANNCDECGKIIGIDSKDLSYKEKHWHEACFLCNKVKQLLVNHVQLLSIRTFQCRTSLVDKQFGSKADRIYCGPCYDAQFATRCDGCGDVFKAGEQMNCHILTSPAFLF